MVFDPAFHHRKSIRLKGYDYSQAGGYYVTIITQGRECMFGKIVNREMVSNEAGRMIEAVWKSLSERFPNVELDIFQVMPNHFHGIIFIFRNPVGAGLVPALGLVPAQGLVPAHPSRATTRVAPTLGKIIGAFKSITTNEYIHGVKQCGWPSFAGKLWQRSYYEHIIRNQSDYEHIANYIAINPAKWDFDEENPPAR